MTAELVPVTFHKIMQSRSYTVIILGSEQKKFAIYTEPHVGQIIQAFLTQEPKPRPLTLDLMNGLFRGLDVRLLQIVINDIEDTIYFARLFVEQTIGDLRLIVEIDARPSDCIALAIMNNIPVFCHKEIVDKAVPVEE
jgi:bifunctional DNase/RNase